MTHNAYIIGSGHTKFGRLSDTLEDLIVMAGREALAEAALDPSEIDAVFLSHFNAGLVADGFPSSLILQIDPALRFKPAARCENACASGSAAVHAGLNLMAAGKARNVLVIGVEKMTHRSTPEVTEALASAGYHYDPAETGLSFPQLFALAAEQYMARFGDQMDVLAKIAAKNHANAMKNPLAQMHKEMPYEFCREVSEKNPLIAPPLRLSDCSLVSDGAAAVVLSTDNGAAGSATKRVRFGAAEHVSDFLPLSRRKISDFEGPERAIRTAYDTAGITVDDLDFAEVHDCFTPAELMIYEAMGLAEKGEGARAIETGRVLADGQTPVNLSGGLKAKGHPVGATGVSMHALSYRQLTGQAGDIQRAGAHCGLVFNMGGAAVANYASVLLADRA
ncbi:thiolase domain-containing protein [Celeribacter sp. HF31]|uniref:thiolase domain-containing protein n=1 Tax=Celeribacter sp. HF31 TaxID=2721558 RepID=UPI0014315DEA|nr:thiolase domain-containing protein [Celeribacter sp. HF31]NIY81239.1 thiolase domain-containing protein [Celeribacter sp. HF31]